MKIRIAKFIINEIAIVPHKDHYELFNASNNEFIQSCDPNELNSTIEELQATA